MSEPALAVGFQPTAAAMLDRVRAARSILLPTHINVDGDSLSSVLALSHVLRAMGKEVIAVVTDGHLPYSLRWLHDERNGPLLYSGQELPPTDLSVLADITGLNRLGQLGKDLADRLNEDQMINLDHHVSNERFGRLNIVDEQAAATAELLYLIFRRWDVPITADLATTLLVGLLTDTLNFQTSSTTPRTLRVGADLIEAGAALEPLVTRLFRVKPFSSARLFGAILGAARLDGRLLSAEITPEMLAACGAEASETEGAISYLSGIEEAVIFALLYKQPQGWRVSLRSNDDRVDVAQLAAHFGGGGHPRAAGCSLPAGQESRDAFFEAARAAIAAIAPAEHSA